MSKRTTNTHQQIKGTEDYIFASTQTERIGNYVFTVNSYYAANSAESAKDRLRDAIGTQMLRSIAKMNSEQTLPFPQKSHAETAGWR